MPFTVPKEVRKVEKLYNDRRERYHIEKSHPDRLIAREIIRTHAERKKKVEEAEKRILELRGQVLSPKNDGMPKTLRQYPDKIGERVAMIEDLQRFVLRNKDMVNAVEKAYQGVGRGRRIPNHMLRKYGDKAALYGKARMCVKAVIEDDIPVVEFENIFPWEIAAFRKEIVQFFDTVIRELDLGDIPG